MFGKLLLIILTTGTVSLALLVNRQQRIEGAHEMSQIHGRLNDFESLLWTMRRNITVACRPERLREQIAALGGTWAPIPCEPTQLEENDEERPKIQLVERREAGERDAEEEDRFGG